MYAEPAITNELSQTPSGFPGLPEVDVCAAASLLANVTVSPGEIVKVAGMKQSGSHPGVEEPSAFSTVYVAANASGAASPIAKITRIKGMIIFFVESGSYRQK